MRVREDAQGGEEDRRDKVGLLMRLASRVKEPLEAAWKRNVDAHKQ